MDSQKLDAILHEPCSYHGSACVSKWPQKQSISEHLISKNFLGEHPRPPQALHAYACIHTIRHTCNPPLKNPGYGPKVVPQRGGWAYFQEL